VTWVSYNTGAQQPCVLTESLPRNICMITAHDEEDYSSHSTTRRGLEYHINRVPNLLHLVHMGTANSAKGSLHVSSCEGNMDSKSMYSVYEFCVENGSHETGAKMTCCSGAVRDRIGVWCGHIGEPFPCIICPCEDGGILGGEAFDTPGCVDMDVSLISVGCVDDVLVVDVSLGRLSTNDGTCEAEESKEVNMSFSHLRMMCATCWSS
jgi:hypothetical protein